MDRIPERVMLRYQGHWIEVVGMHQLVRQLMDGALRNRTKRARCGAMTAKIMTPNMRADRSRRQAEEQKRERAYESSYGDGSRFDEI